jgi:predicted small metal-binding protein
MALEIKCSDLGHNDCGWKAVSNTEDKLADYVALHMRDQHGIREFTQEMIADVKKLGKVVTPSDKSKDPSMKVYRCSKCDWRYIAQTEDLIADAVAVHERDVHDVKLFTPEMVGKVKNSLNPWS